MIIGIFYFFFNIDSDLESYYPEKEEEIIYKYSKNGKLI